MCASFKYFVVWYFIVTGSKYTCGFIAIYNIIIIIPYEQHSIRKH